MTTDPETTSTEQTTPVKSGGIAVYVVVVLTLLVFTFCMGFDLPAVVVYFLCFGWISYLQQLVTNLTVTTGQVVGTVVFLLLFTWALHQSLKKIIAWKRTVAASPASSALDLLWQKRWTCGVLVLGLGLMASGISVIQISDQTWSMLMGKDQIFDPYSGHREAMRRSTSRNNLKQIGLALHNYHDTHDLLPPGGVFDRAGQPRHSWMTQILPYVDQAPLYNQIDFQQPWTAEANRQAFQTELNVFENPGRLGTGRSRDNLHGYMPAEYAANSRVLNVNSGLNLKAIKDGISNTLLAGEVNSQVKAWGDPTNFRDPAKGINSTSNGFGSPFKGGAYFLMGDGAVRFISEDIDPSILKALATPDGGEPVGDF
ncbi:hypothetical protein Enr10x_01540 [Gimesia panareensis]|uniref:DUF1559 domain-containing protein n=1 Tax=Gimesia panareensis TaxID=2527978 RepID=A0A517PZQ6_9PLAN|nr:DUF1559 domain-containing protein [Gimesia panareensis]QDT24862.1 hypothetical protein Enr10x_01540 [Gimesia panareensis]